MVEAGEDVDIACRQLLALRPTVIEPIRSRNSMNYKFTAFQQVLQSIPELKHLWDGGSTAFRDLPAKPTSMVGFTGEAEAGMKIVFQDVTKTFAGRAGNVLALDHI